MSFTHVVAYAGNSIWQDGVNEIWRKEEDKSCGILRVRQYDYEGDQDAFFSKRPDIEFQVGYGAMTIETVDNTPKLKKSAAVIPEVVPPADEVPTKPATTGTGLPPTVGVDSTKISGK